MLQRNFKPGYLQGFLQVTDDVEEQEDDDALVDTKSVKGGGKSNIVESDEVEGAQKYL